MPVFHVRVCSLALGLSVCVLSGCAGQTSLKSTESPESQGADPATSIGFEEEGGWTYPESNGTWGPECGADPQTYQQSPIDFTSITSVPWTATVGAPNLLISQGTFHADDQNVVFGYGNWNQITIAPDQSMNPPFDFAASYKMTSFHFHQPAEHKVGPNQTGMVEMHIKTLDQFRNVAVFSLLMFPTTPDNADPLLAPALPGIMNAIANKGRSVVDLSGLLIRFGSTLTYTYLGSTTTPPCSPNIRWFVNALPSGVVTDDYDNLLTALTDAGMPQADAGGNARLTQPVLSGTSVSMGFLTPATADE